jgi:carbon-monoxide dehydrogenase medium subunit
VHAFDYVPAQSLDEVVEVLHQFGERAKPLAGGTDMVLFMERGRWRPDIVVELPHIPPFVGVELGDGHLRVGSRTTMRELETHPLVRAQAPLLATAAGEVGSVQIRNLATVGGNIGTASPAGDTLPALLALDASVRLRSKSGERIVPITEFFVGPGQTVMRPDEVITDVLVPVPSGRVGMAFYKLAVRRYMDIAIVDVAVLLTVNDDGAIIDARVALGAVAPTPIRVYDAEERLKGNELSETLAAEAAELAQQASRPISDQRGSAEYRRLMVQRLTRRLLWQAYQDAMSKAATGR